MRVSPIYTDRLGITTERLPLAILARSNHRREAAFRTFSRRLAAIALKRGYCSVPFLAGYVFPLCVSVAKAVRACAKDFDTKDRSLRF